MNKKRMSRLLSGMLCIILVFSFCISSSFAVVQSYTVVKTSAEIVSGVSVSITCTYTKDSISGAINLVSMSSNIVGNTSNYTWQQTGSVFKKFFFGDYSANVAGNLTQYLYVDGKLKTYTTQKNALIAFAV